MVPLMTVILCTVLPVELLVGFKGVLAYQKVKMGLKYNKKLLMI